MTDLEELLGPLAARNAVPGAVLGVLQDGEVRTAATGVTNLREGIAVTPDTLFQIGSITKVWTATLVVQLVDEGRLALEDRVVDRVPGLRLPDGDVTVRQLLDHTSGLDGDHFLDTGRGDDCLARFADSLADVPSLHRPGAAWSYCNAGFSLLGRLVEVVDGVTWDTALRRRLVEPLGLTHTVTLPEEALLHRTAVGHVRDGDGAWQPHPQWVLQRSSGPAGLITQRVADLLAFAQLHLTGGLGPQRQRVLSAESAARMATPGVEVTERWLIGGAMGLGWFVDDWDGRRTLAHGGATLGQNAYLRLVPDRGLGVALLVNGGSHDALARDVFAAVLGEQAGLTPPAWPTPDPSAPVDVDAFLGTYGRAGHLLQVAPAGDQLVLHYLDPATGTPAVTGALHPFLPRTLLASFDGHDRFMPVTAHTVEGRPHLHVQGRTTPRRPT